MERSATPESHDHGKGSRARGRIYLSNFRRLTRLWINTTDKGYLSSKKHLPSSL